MAGMGRHPTDSDRLLSDKIGHWLGGYDNDRIKKALLRADQLLVLNHPMFKTTLLVLIVAAIGQATAAPCVKVRDGTDGTGLSGGYKCLKFSKSEKQAAAKIHLQLTSSYEAVWSQLKINGWALDPKWLSELEPEEKSKLPICGSGWDATCQIQVTKNKERVLLIFSGTNPGTPLIWVGPADA